MTANRDWRPVAFAAFVVAVVAVSLLAIFANDRDSDPTVPRVEATEPPGKGTGPAEAERGAPAEGTAAEERANGGGTDERELELYRAGNPVVWVRSGEKATIHAAPGGQVVETVGDETEFGSTTNFAVFETEGDWVGVPNPYTGNGKLGWIELDGRRLKAGYTSREIVVDLSEFRAQLLIDDEVVRTFTVAIGAPGTSTPTGHFAVTDTFRGDLNPAYGCCAVALTAEQPNLPSGWLGGDRIAIHGTSGPLGAAISSGCVRAADRDVNALVNEVPPGTPVLVRQ
jgi:lipoprotein-anchoring transpeptidase ErfK/SrfK